MNILNSALDGIMHRVKAALIDQQRRIDSKPKHMPEAMKAMADGMKAGIDSAILIIEREFKKAMTK